MPWSKNNFPPSMQSLTTQVRDKAIEIANALLEDGYEEGRAISIATAQAKEWARNRDIPVKEDPNAGPDQHVVPQNEGWAVRSADAEKTSYTFKTKDEAVEKGREIAQKHHSTLVIHKKDGQIQERRSYSGS